MSGDEWTRKESENPLFVPSHGTVIGVNVAQIQRTFTCVRTLSLPLFAASFGRAKTAGK